MPLKLRISTNKLHCILHVKFIVNPYSTHTNTSLIEIHPADKFMVFTNTAYCEYDLIHMSFRVC